MIWLTWRLFRTQALVVLAAVVVVAAALAGTGSQLVELYEESGKDFVAQFAANGTYRTLYLVGGALVYALPALVGAFWGAPMIARELESGTHRLVWNQSVTRGQWLTTKLGVIGMVALVAGLISLAMTWWANPLDATVNRSEPDGDFYSITRLSGTLLGARGMVPVAYVVLALAIGVTAGLVIRRTVPAMAVTLVAVVAVQVLMPLVVQPNVIAPVQRTIAITEQNLRGMLADDSGNVRQIVVQVNEPGAWVTTNHTVDADGKPVDRIPEDVADCGPPEEGEVSTGAGPSKACFEQLAAAGYEQEVEFQPASRYWQLQWIQTGILLGLAALLTGFCFWRIRRDLT